MIASTANPSPVAGLYDGVYLPIEVSGYLLATMPAEKRPPTSQRIFRWIRRGLVAPEVRKLPGRSITISFADLVTCQAITLFREAGLSLDAILQAEQYFADLYGMAKPFAYRQFWYSPRDIFGRLKDTLISGRASQLSSRTARSVNPRSVETPDLPHLTSFAVAPDDTFEELSEAPILSGTRGGQIAWDFLTEGLESWPHRLSFSETTHRADAWWPTPDISLEPDIQFGQPCLAGTRIPTSALWSYAAGGDSYEAIARAYQIEVKDVEQAVNWENRVRAALDAQKPIPT